MENKVDLVCYKQINIKGKGCNVGDGSSSSLRVFRGGDWNNNASVCTVANRNNNNPYNRNNNIGFRLVRSSLSCPK
ncbi:MAG: SUMF1/EgtB/PvdO family nonheme iron enzyme [Treponema sp.]|nr:SUMF1/EgtB/PvdO family nonheme iron enzyme [Treponema sp.]